MWSRGRQCPCQECYCQDLFACQECYRQDTFANHQWLVSTAQAVCAVVIVVATLWETQRERSPILGPGARPLPSKSRLERECSKPLAQACADPNHCPLRSCRAVDAGVRGAQNAASLELGPVEAAHAFCRYLGLSHPYSVLEAQRHSYSINCRGVGSDGGTARFDAKTGKWEFCAGCHTCLAHVDCKVDRPSIS